MFRNIISTEPPVLESDNSYSYNKNYTAFPSSPTLNLRYDYLSRIADGGFMDELYDSLQLTRSILPGLLPLMNLNDYEKPIMRLLRTMVDSNLVKGKEYEIYFSKFLLEAKQELKKQASEEKKSAIEKAEEEKAETKSVNVYKRNEEDKGNEDLITYATLLLPFRET